MGQGRETSHDFLFAVRSDQLQRGALLPKRFKGKQKKQHTKKQKEVRKKKVPFDRAAGGTSRRGFALVGKKKGRGKKRGWGIGGKTGRGSSGELPLLRRPRTGRASSRWHNHSYPPGVEERRGHGPKGRGLNLCEARRGDRLDRGARLSSKKKKNGTKEIH